MLNNLIMAVRATEAETRLGGARKVEARAESGYELCSVMRSTVIRRFRSHLQTPPPTLDLRHPLPPDLAPLSDLMQEATELKQQGVDAFGSGGIHMLAADQ